MLARAYKNVVVACGAGATCFLKNDDALAPLPRVNVAIEAIRLRDGSRASLGSARLSLPRGANAVAWLCAGGGASPPANCAAWSALLPPLGCAASGNDCVVTASVKDAASGALLASNAQLLVAPGRLNASRAVRVTAAVGEEAADGSIPVTLTAAGAGAAPALYVTLFTLANGRFDDNFITLLSGTRVVNFLPFAPQQRGVLAGTVRVNALNELLGAPKPPRPSSGTCTTMADTDVTNGGVYASGSTLADCCKACWEEPTQQCLSAAFNPVSPGCWLKFGKDFISKPGVQTCVLDLPPKPELLDL